MLDPARSPRPTPDAAPPLLGGRLYRDLSELPTCVTVSVSVEIYADDQTEAFVRPARPASAPRPPTAARR